MKKEYTKPEIMFEDFTLSTNIAGDCGNVVTTHAENVCGIEFGVDFIFLTGVQGCTKEIETDDHYSGICYHNPTDIGRLFNS